ncbi:MAG TPA: hypothetical protein PKA47_18185 [Accumulibacter sp.]|nr:hypothetical protein [Accumulibacter sp.]
MASIAVARDADMGFVRKLRNGQVQSAPEQPFLMAQSTFSEMWHHA